jgi:hypothetical protein
MHSMHGNHPEYYGSLTDRRSMSFAAMRSVA